MTDINLCAYDLPRTLGIMELWNLGRQKIKHKQMNKQDNSRSVKCYQRHSVESCFREWARGLIFVDNALLKKKFQ